MQAFWVRVPGAGPTGGTFNVGNAARISTQNPKIWRMSATPGTVNSLKITAKNSSSSDETIIRFVDKAEESFDQNFDAYKMINDGNTPSIYTKIGDDTYSINSLPDTLTDFALPVHLEGVVGGYSISIDGVKDFDNSYAIILEDKLIHKEQNLRSNPNYSFMVYENQNPDRFILKFKKEQTFGDTENLNNSIIVWGNENKVNVLFNENMGPEKADITISNIMGEKVLNFENIDVASGKLSINCPFDTGIYIVKVITKSTTYSKRVFLSNY
jgi:hypothetical protein